MSEPAKSDLVTNLKTIPGLTPNSSKIKKTLPVADITNVLNNSLDDYQI